jgi:AmmeMemoRadiSam system protein B
MLRKIGFKLLLGVAAVILAAVVYTAISNPSQKISPNNMNSQKIRAAAVSGSFYPADPAELKIMIEGFLSKAQIDETITNPRMIIVPHAGYQYSGAVAAKAFKQLTGQDIKRAVIIGPSHHFSFAGLVLAATDVWQTPLGEVKVSLLNKELAHQPNFKVDDKVHEPEHA